MGPVNRLAYIKGRIPLKSILVFIRLLIKMATNIQEKCHSVLCYSLNWIQQAEIKT